MKLVTAYTIFVAALTTGIVVCVLIINHAGHGAN